MSAISMPSTLGMGRPRRLGRRSRPGRDLGPSPPMSSAGPPSLGVADREGRHMPAGERMVTINGAASCVEVQGEAGDPSVLLVGSSVWSWPDGLCERLVAGGRRVIRYDV